MPSIELCDPVFDREYAPVHDLEMAHNIPAILRKLMEVTPGKQQGLAKRLSTKGRGGIQISQPQISRWLKGQEPERPNYDRIIEVAAELGVLSDAQSGGHLDSEDVLPNDDVPSRRNAISTVHPYEPNLPNAMPVVSSALSAGPGQASPERVSTHKGGITYSADAVLGEITLPSSVSASLSAAPTNRIHWFEVRGDSMEPTLSGGDWVGVNTLDLAIGQGGVFALLDGNGEILVKRLRRLRGEDNSKVQIISDNPRQGVDTEELDAITIFGRIVARISRVG